VSTKKSLAFYRSWWEKGNEKDGKTRLEFYDAILNYAFDGVITDVSPTVKDLFDMIKPVIDMAILRGEAAQERGKRGGAPRGNQNARKSFGKKGIAELEKEQGEEKSKAPKTPEVPIEHREVIDFWAEEEVKMEAERKEMELKKAETDLPVTAPKEDGEETFEERKARIINEYKVKMGMEPTP
jgi:hypothetical protein